MADDAGSSTPQDGGTSQGDASTPDASTPDPSTEPNASDADSVQNASSDANQSLPQTSADGSDAGAPACSQAEAPAETGDFGVTVTDSATSQPISGADVQISGPTSAQAASDNSGTANFTGVPVGDYTISVSKDGYSAGSGSGSVAASTSNSASVALTGSAPATGDLAVTVIDSATNQPIAGANVELSGAGSGAATTAASGVASFPGLTAGDYSITATMDGYPNGSGTATVAAGTSSQAQVALTATTASFSVSVRNSAGPLAGATVSVDGQGWDGVTDASGNFDFGQHPPATYTVTATLGGASASQTLNCPANASTQFTIALPTITSLTVSTVLDRARTNIGVGEAVTVSISPGTATWSVTGGGTVAPTSGPSTTFTAGDSAATSVVTAQVSGSSLSITFTVVEPSGVIMQQASGTGVWHVQGTPSVGFKGSPFIQPADVSFENIEVRERHCPAVTTGYFNPQSGQDHDPGSDAFHSVGPAVAGQGSPVNGTDSIQGGDGGIGPPYSDGTFTWNIPWEFHVGSGAPKPFPQPVTHQKKIDATGRLTISKGGHTESKGLNDVSSNY